MTKRKTSSAIRLYVICAIFSALSMPLLDAQTPADSVVIRQVDSLIQVVRNYSGKQDFDQALGTLAIAEAIALEKLGRESAAYGACCSNHGRIRSIQRQYDDALQWAFQAAEIQEKTIGKMHPDRGRTLQTIAASCANSYQYERGLPYGLEAKDIFEHTLGKADINYGRAISVIAICYAQLGRFEDAEPLFLEGRDLAQAKGKDTEECAIIIGNLSHFYLLMGNFQKSLQFSLEATELKRKLYGEDAPEYAFGLQNLASSYGKLLDFKKAESLYLQALSIYEKKYGKEDQDYVEILQFLATMYSIMSDHQKSVPLFLEVLAIKEKILGKENWGYGIAANNLAVEYIETGEWEKARLLLTEYVEINKKSGGTDQPEYAESLNNLAIAYVNLGLYEKSEALYGEISARLQAAMSRSLHHLSERETQEYLKKYSYFQDCALSLAQVKYRKNGYTTPLSGTCYDNALYFKGFLLNAAARARNTAAADPANTDRLNLLKSVERKLGDAYVTPLAERDSAAVADLEAQANDLEKNLARNIAGYTDATRSVKWQDVQKQLQAGDAAIEFVRFDFYDKSVMHASDSVFYAALIIRPGSDQPRFITLFEEREIDALFKNKGARKSDYVNTLYASPARSAGGQKNLYQAIWQPLESALADTKTVYFSPAGLLHRINFNAITDKDGKPLGDRLNFVQLGSTRQLALPQPTANAALSLEARLFGGINYESDTLNNPPVEVKSPAPSDYAGTRGNFRFEDADSTLRGGAWGYLPWTDKEVSNVARILNQSGYQPILYNGSKGSEEAFKSIGATGASPRVLHLATHGYFFPDPQRLPQQAGANESAFKSATHPMIRSGLILAGGNYAWKTGKPFRPEGEDGVITAYEISQMNLSNTELVVLSACETGLGDIEGNEGVYGLQRAFKIAGVRYIVMSLWQVPDAQTQELMTAFYTNWLTRKMVIPEAFSAAQKTMQEKYEHPFFWAGFVLLR